MDSGIPIILVTIARALRNEDSKSWEDALTQLKQFDGESILEEPYKMIEVSYKFLKAEELKKLLLLCAQLNHRAIAKDDLLKYAMGLNLFKGCKTLKEVSNRLHRYLSELKGCCLLQDGKHHGVVKMHDVVHKFASSVALRDHHVFSVASDGELQDWPSKDELEHFSAISLPECHLPPHQMLPAFDNPDLESFLMLRGECAASLQIPDNFFVGMKGLRLMHLTRMSLSPALVSSFEALVKLRTLCLDGCKLSDISVIGELQNLQAISLVGSSIVLVPPEIGKLGSTLKLLDLQKCKKLKRIAAGVISRLTLLEDLRIGKSFTTWQRLEGTHNKEEMASMEEFKNLQNLINVEIEIKEHAFPKDLVFKKLEAFKIFFGNERRYLSGEYISTRTLEVHASTTVEFDKFYGEGSKALLTSAECLLLAGVIGSATVSEMNRKGFPELKHLKIRFVKKIQYIVKKSYKTCIFPKLETLELYGLFKLERICDHPLPVGSFENLGVLQTSRCHMLKDLLTANLARGLLNLKEIQVAECDSMESIIVENEEEIGFTHQLRALKLYTLPRFMSFCGFKQLEELSSPTPLFNKKIMFPKLEVLELMWLIIEKIWDDRIVITAEGTCWLQNLTILIVNECDNLSYLFTSSTVKCFAQLKSLNVSTCEFIEEIVVATCEGEVEGDKLLLFPKLESLHLYNLPKLKIFCPANLLECQSLQNLDIFDCPLLNGFIGGNGSSLFDEKIIFPKLEKLRLRKLKSKKIWDFHHLSIAAEETTCWFQNLASLEVGQCDNLNYLFGSSMVKSLAQLKQLEVRKSESIEETIASTEREMTGDVPLLLPKIDNIKLEDLPKLKRFCEANLLECTLLRELVIESCSELKTFVSANDSSNLDYSTTLFTEKVAFPNMEELRIANCEKNILFGFNNTQQLNDAFAKRVSSLNYCDLDMEGLQLKYENQRITLQTVGSGFQVPRIFFAFLKSWPKLDEVAVSGYSTITQLFPCELDHLTAAADGDDTDSEANTFARIGHLVLANLSNMKQIWSEHSPLKYHVIPESLEVEGCESLLTLAPPSPTLFKNLTGLFVRRCPILIRLVASSNTAKSLVNLKEMHVAECDSLEEIVGIDDQWDSSGEYIVFEKLEILHLQCLNKLTSFCSTSDCNFRFPSLNRLYVSECPKMKLFSLGDLSTPNLLRVCPFSVEEEDEKRTQNEGRWEGDLNSTIRHLFEEKVTTMVEVEDEHEHEHDEDEANNY